MAHFYAVARGGRGETTRTGTRNSGLRTVAASWHGSVRASLWNTDEGVDMADVYLEPWHGNGAHRLIYSGPVSGAKIENEG